MSKVEVCVIGAGISGLHTAHELAKQGVRVKLLEARERVGGRIHSPCAARDSNARFDLGPSWFWPGQTNIESLVMELGLQDSVFQQHAQGDAIYEPIGTAIQRGIGGISMAGSYRVNGGLRTVTQSLMTRLIELAGEHALETDAQVASVELTEQNVVVRYAQGKECHANKLVLAMPPRVALSTIAFTPDLKSERKDELNAVATWMAGHAKAVIIYPRPFWRDAGLSGDVISQRGPLSEIHDATSYQGTPALFGFFATPPGHRKTDKTEIEQQIKSQLVRIFGEQASAPDEILYSDWAREPLTATERDQHILNHHPSNYRSTIVEPDWQARLVWSGSEAAKGHYNGYIEGALLASRAALAAVFTDGD